MSKIDVAILGFQPDLDNTTPGVITECNNFVPYIDGFGTGPEPSTSGFQTLADACRGAVVARKLDDSARIIAGTQEALWEGSGQTWSDVSKVGGYVGGAENRWRFCQFGNYTIAVNRADATQQSQSGNFADLGTNCPKASLCETVAGFVMLLDYNDGVNEYADGWWCSPYQNPTGDWTAAVATQAANGRLLDTPGPIRAGRRLGKEMVAYKERSMYMGFYDGPPVIWRWQLVPGEVGAVSQEAVIDAVVNNVPVHIFAGFDDFYIFDGSRPISIGQGIRKWWNDNVPAAYRYRVKALHDRANGTVHFGIPDGGGSIEDTIAYNYRTNRWGMGAPGDMEATLEYITPGVTYNGLGSLYSTYHDLPDDLSYDSPFWTSSTPVPAFFSSSHRLRLYTGVPTASESSSMQFGFVGSEEIFRTLTRIRPRMIGTSAPDAGTCSLYYGKTPIGASVISTAPYNTSSNKFDVMKSSHWFGPAMEFDGNYRMTGYSLEFEEDGDE